MDRLAGTFNPPLLPAFPATTLLTSRIAHPPTPPTHTQSLTTLPLWITWLLTRRSTNRFKVYEDGWASASKSRGDDDLWGVKDMNACCGKMDVKIPSNLPAGDYLLRAEVIALHTAQSAGGAQFYMSCYQLTVTGGGSASPATVKFPGAYKSSDAGIQINIHAAVSKYVVPGPAVIEGGTTKVPGQGASCAKKQRLRGTNDIFETVWE